ncbi:MAG: T9SS type A sorting domain-containing protein [Ignavibacteriales bacterium]|nr:T9SS type A sorting domain-containing protein [Ignavibacteriales bacterium]
MAVRYNYTGWKVLITADTGKSWSEISTGLPSNIKINHLAFKSNLAVGESPQYLYAATDNGVYKIDLNRIINSSFVINYNMLSVPDVVNDFTKTVVCPTANSNASWYDGATQTYKTASVLENGKGYFVKFPSNGSVTYTGWPFYSYKVKVYPGWNLIGSISGTVQTSSIIQEPSGIVSIYYKYVGGYVSTTVIEPGMGIWVQSSALGYLTLPTSPLPKTVTFEDEYLQYDRISFTDANGEIQQMYVRNSSMRLGKDRDSEMPPDPPGFTAYFKAGNYLQSVSPTADQKDLSIITKRAVFPLTMLWDIKATNQINYRATIDGREIEINGTGSITIQNPVNGTIPLYANAENIAMPKSYVLEQNYPNPFNPSTTISYQLPNDCWVTIKVFNILGEEIKTLVDKYETAGYKSIDFDASNFPNGVYYYRLQSGSSSSSSGEDFTDVKKMVLIK